LFIGKKKRKKRNPLLSYISFFFFSPFFFRFFSFKEQKKMAEPLMVVNMDTLLEFEVPEERCPLVLKVFQNLAHINKRDDIIKPGENRPVLRIGDNRLDVVNLIIMINEIFETEPEDVPITEVFEVKPPKTTAASNFLAKPYTKEELTDIDLDAVPLDVAWGMADRLVATARADPRRNEDLDVYNRTTLALSCAIYLTLLNGWEGGQKLKQTLTHIQRLYKSVEEVPDTCSSYKWDHMGMVAAKVLPTLKRWKDTAEANHKLAIAAHSNKSGAPSSSSSSKRRRSDDVESVEMEGVAPQVMASPEPARVKATTKTTSSTATKKKQQQQQSSSSTSAPALTGLAAAAMASMSK
jgi:hypothetical protein